MNPSSPPFEPDKLVKSLADRPGVYCMVDADGEILYVGKAKSLRDRVSSYFRGGPHTTKTLMMLARVADIRVTVTGSEGEALLLENNLIKAHRPRYNILLRDDKSYPYIRLDAQHPFPKMQFYRGAQRRGGRYFGPYPSAAAVRSTLKELQRLFHIRQCTDGYFANRHRPCLQFQIDRCTAPCVGYISEADYANDVQLAIYFLEGRSNLVVDDLVRRMEAAATDQAYERAAKLRDQIARIKQVQAQQNVSAKGGDCDTVAVSIRNGSACVAVGFIRGGRHLGHRTFFPRLPQDTQADELRASFLAQYYLERDLPDEVLCDGAVTDRALLEHVLAERKAGRFPIVVAARGNRRQWVVMAKASADQALTLRMTMDASVAERWEGLRLALARDDLPGRIECFDISHTQGEATVASCVVFEPTGAIKSQYRRFNIEGVAPGDDYAAMRQAIKRRYSRVQKEEAAYPDVVLIDGGPGQLKVAQEVFADLGIDDVMLAAVSKGPDRKAGQEQIWLAEAKIPLRLPSDSLALRLIQQIRDEAHRFAITGHRARRGKVRTASALEDIPGIGPKRRQQLLKQFGGLQQLSRIGVEDLAKLPGISRELAERIYAGLHPINP